jgi:hypothetical protein
VSKWRNVRLDMSAYNLLWRYRDRLAAAVAINPDSYPDYLSNDRVSMSDAVRMLLDTQRKRGDRSRKSRRTRGQTEGPLAAYNGTGENTDAGPVILPLPTADETGPDA